MNGRVIDLFLKYFGVFRRDCEYEFSLFRYIITHVLHLEYSFKCFCFVAIVHRLNTYTTPVSYPPTHKLFPYNETEHKS